LETQFKVTDWVRVKGKPYQIAGIDTMRYKAENEEDEDIFQVEYILHNGMIVTKNFDHWRPEDGELVSLSQNDELGTYAIVRAYDSLRSDYFAGCEPFVNEVPSFLPSKAITHLKQKTSIFDQTAVDPLVESKGRPALNKG
jgi:hypothetical protein